MPDSVWANTETDTDRLIKRRASEYHGAAAKIARDLGELSQLTDADASRREKVRQVTHSADVLKNQLQDLARQ